MKRPIAKTVLALCLCLSIYTVVQSQQSDIGVVTKYDRFKDESVYRFTESLMPDRPGFVLLSLLTTYKGEHPRLIKPDRVTVLLESYTDEWYFLKTTNVLRVIQDGERYELGAMNTVDSSVISKGVVETLALTVPFSVAEKLSKADKIEIQVGSYEAEIKAPAIANLKRWVRSFE